MSKVMILCPATGQEVFTGIEVPSEIFDQIPEIVARMRCPACKDEHRWSKRDARLGGFKLDGKTERPASD